jgi:hypothetical protein
MKTILKNNIYRHNLNNIIKHIECFIKNAVFEMLSNFLVLSELFL